MKTYSPTINMIIESLDLQNFRNYQKLHIGFSKGINLLYGNNAQGKTNVLEAIFLCATTKSHRGAKDRELIRFDQDEAHIKLQVRKRDMPHRLDIHIKKNKAKGIAINGLPLKTSAELFGLLNVVFFSPEDLGIIKNGPAERRRFIDIELCQLDSFYLSALSSYNKILQQRNKLLKELQYHKDWQDTLDIWDAQLLRYGKEIIGYREKFSADLHTIIAGVHHSICAGKEELFLTYEKNVDILQYEKRLAKARETDIRQKMTNVGPHRDDLGFFIRIPGEENGMDVRRFGSQGQQRTAALSLKLAEIELVKRMTGDYPVLLLDDVLSELDFARQTHLLASIQNIQTIITGTGLEDFTQIKLPLERIFQVKQGEILTEI